MSSSSDEHPYEKRSSRARSSRFGKVRDGSTRGSIPPAIDRRDTSASADRLPDRPSPRRSPAHPLERVLLWIVSVHLIFLPWALGTMHVWAQSISFGLAVAGLGVALAPRTYEVEADAAEFRMLPHAKLLRFPVFWLGLALLALVAVHGFNPAWEFQTDGRLQWVRPIAHINWLPSGARVPFEKWGPWRMLMIYSSAWMTVCTIWVGLTRRRTLQRLFIVLAVNGLALAVFGLAQRLLDATEIFGFVKSSNAAFFASFFYKNHAGAYLNLALAIACGLGAWYYVRGVRRMEKSNPSGVFAFFVTCIAVSVLISYARGATFIMLGYLCVVVGAFVHHQWRLPKDARSPVIAFALLIVFGLFLKTGLEALNSDVAWDRLRAAISGTDVSVEVRQTATMATMDALEQNWVSGIGSGSFQFLFPVYQQNYPEILTRPDGARMFWEHAHNDLLEIPLELGLPGVLIILAAFGSWGVTLKRSFAWRNPLSASVILGCLFMVAMAWGEFVFQCPAILITWCALWPAAARWAELEEQRARTAPAPALR